MDNTPTQPNDNTTSGGFPRQFYSDQEINTLGLVTPYQIGSGIMRGTQGVGSTSTTIDSASNRITVGKIVLDGKAGTITVTNTDGSSQGLGIIPGTTNQYGFFSTSSNGSVVWKRVGPTGYTYDLATSKNVIQDGLLPDNSYGWFVAATGYNVSDAITP